MKSSGTLFLLLAVAGSVQAAWEAVNTGLGSLDVRALVAVDNVLMVGTAAGIYRSENGTSWADASGNIANQDIRDLRRGDSSLMLWAATEAGAYFTLDQQTYTACATSGAGTGPVNYYWFGSFSGSESTWALGTEGSGILHSTELDGPWIAANTGLSGAALNVNDLSGYRDDELDYLAIATDGGVFISTDSLASWQGLNDNLGGDQLVANRLVTLGALVMVATDGGLLATPDYGTTWYPLVTGSAILNLALYPMSALGLATGDGLYMAQDLFTYGAVDMTGTSGGPFTCVAMTATHVYIGSRGGGVFREEIGQLTGLEERPLAGPREFRLLGNHPNPFNPDTRISFALGRPGSVRLLVHDLLGREVAVRDMGYRTAGVHDTTLDGRMLPSGTYLYSLEVDDQLRDTRRLSVIK